MTLSIFFLACLVFGFCLSAVAFLSGSAHLHLHGHHFPHGGHAHGGHAHGTNHGTGYFNFGTLAVFIMWFGGAGSILVRLGTLGRILVVVGAAIGGLAGATLIFLFLSRFLTREDKPLDPADYRIVGALGRVSATVRPAGTGEMIFVQQGRRTGIAIRSENGTALEKDTEVVVTRFEDGIAFVRSFDDLTA